MFRKIFTLIISLTFLLVNSLPILATNSTQRASLENNLQGENQDKTAKTQIEITKIEFSKSNNLENSWELIQQILQKNEETSLTFDSRLELSKISFNLPIQIIKSDNLQQVLEKNAQIKNSVLDSIIKQKSEEKKFLDKQIYDISDKSIENLQEQLTILANLDQKELENLKIQNYNSQNLFANSLTITTNNQNLQNPKNLEKIASINSVKIEEIDLTKADVSDKRDQDLKPKIKLKSNKIAKKTAKLNQIQSQNKQLLEQSSAPSLEMQSSFSSSSLPIKPEISPSRSTLESSSSETSALVTPKLSDLLEIENEDENNSINNSNSNSVVISENLVQEIQQNDLESNEELNEQNKLDKNSPRITKIRTFKYKNPFYISQEEQSQRNQEIEQEREKALAHNRQFKQYYSQSDYQKMVEARTLPDPKIYPFAVVDENGREIEPKELDKTLGKTGWLDSILKFGSVNTSARGLNNSAVPLLIYSWTNPNLTFDVPNGNTNSGTQLTIYGRHGGENQTFRFENDTNRITINGKCLDVFGGIGATAQIGLWGCHYGDNQKWIMVGTSLRPLTNQNLCVEPQGGLNQGGKLILWYCNGTSPQMWVSGLNNFGSNFNVNIHASRTNIISVTPNPGHVLVSYKIDNALVNTQSAWPGYDTDCLSNQGRINNICDNDAAYVDKIDDWDYVRYNDPAFRVKTSYISKRLSDVYRYNSGYRWGLLNNGMDNVNYYFWPGGDTNTHNCATLSVKIWNNIMGDLGYSTIYVPRPYLPSDVWAFI